MNFKIVLNNCMFVTLNTKIAVYKDNKHVCNYYFQLLRYKSITKFPCPRLTLGLIPFGAVVFFFSQF